MQVVASGQVVDLLGSLIDQIGKGPEEYLRFAPIVVVGKVISNETDGPPQPSVWTPNVSVQPHRVICSLEEVIRSDNQPISETLSFTYFSTEPHAYNPYHKFTFEAASGHRYLFALLRQLSSLRSIGDVGNYSVIVYSGRHSPVHDARAERTPPDEGKVGKRIAQILLEPGEGFEPREFARNIAWYLLIAEAVGSHLDTYELVRRLLERPELSVQASACFELNRFFPGQYECLERIQHDEKQDAQTRAKAGERLIEAYKVDEDLLKRLRDPALLGTSLMKPDSREQNYEQLRILLAHPKPLYRSLACVALRRYYAERSAARCDAH